MRIANLDNRAALVIGRDGAETAVDIATASNGQFGPDLPSIYQQWEQVTAWAAGLDTAALAATAVSLDRARLGAPSPTPRQVFAIGLNYDDHAAESGFESPTNLPPVFTKYVSSFSGPDTFDVSPVKSQRPSSTTGTRRAADPVDRECRRTAHCVFHHANLR